MTPSARVSREGGGGDKGEGTDVDVKIGHLAVEELTVLKVPATDDDIGVGGLQGRQKGGEVRDAFRVGALEDDVEAKLDGVSLGAFHDGLGELGVLVGESHLLGRGIGGLDHVQGAGVVLAAGSDSLDDVFKTLLENLVAGTAVVHVQNAVLLRHGGPGEGEAGAVGREDGVDFVLRHQPLDEARHGFLLGFAVILDVFERDLLALHLDAPPALVDPLDDGLYSAAGLLAGLGILS
jgi:hypothetical protein